MQSQQVKLQQRLKRSASKRIAKLGLGLTPSCHTLIERMIRNGVERMTGQGALEREEQIWHAEQNLSRCLSKLSEKARNMGTFPQVNDKAFDKVLKEQCPIWPYC